MNSPTGGVNVKKQTVPNAQAEHRKLSQHAADSIRDSIIAGEFVPGRKLLES
ncbi:hypothetical protein LCGC14_2597110, partial [marine sediment metagenome]